MSSPAQIQANQVNCRRSTGPKTDAGKRKASQNAYKHGLRVDRDKLLREEAIAFESRMHRWSSPGGASDINEFLLHDNVFLSFEMERVKRAHLERLRTHIENAESVELEDVHDLGARLFL